jgi:hypothetical protein
MRTPITETLTNALSSGTVAGIAVTAATALAGKREAGSYVAPINATSHIFWGDNAASQNNPSLKYTLTGFALNHASAIFWAAFYERFFGRRAAGTGGGSTLLRPLVGGAVVAAGAYVTDYYLMPKRVTPGFEKRLSGRSLMTVFGVLALGLAARDLVGRSAAR